ncbi:Bug family tripartite tricarboxylate transporter substrate binding protein [Aminobacterium mobile]
MRKVTKRVLMLALAVVVLLCGTNTLWAAEYPSKPFEFIAPGGAGGGWDTTIRLTAKVLENQGIVTQPMPVTNKPGGGGAVALAYLQKKKGNPYTFIIYSPPLLLINLTGQTPLSFKDTTPIAMLINDYGAFAVPKSSPYKSIQDVMSALKKDPKSVKVGGASSAGSMDHIQFLQAAKAAGVQNLKEIPYISLQEGSMAALLGNHVDLLSTGMAETVGLLESGDIRVLAITGPQRAKEGPLAQIPTLKEAGINTVFVNWRGIFGTPDMPDYAVKYMANALQKMCDTGEWDGICAQNGWAKTYLGPEEFKTFLEEANGEYKELLDLIGFKGTAKK